MPRGEPSGGSLRQSGGGLLNPMNHPHPPGLMDDRRQGLIPAWTGAASAWCGAIAALGAIALPVIGKWRRSTGAVRYGHWFSGDMWTPFPLYLALAALVLGLAVLWQSRHRQKPYPAVEINHRAQAWAGILLGAAAIALIYLYVLAYVAWRAL